MGGSFHFRRDKVAAATRTGLAMNDSISVTDTANIPPAAVRRAKAQPRSPAREHVDYIEYFRAVAIVLIVAGHAMDLSWAHLQGGPIAGKEALGIVSALIDGGTFYFVFISGFLYRLVFHGRVKYADFMRKKAVNIGLPYLILGIPLAFYQMFASGFHATLYKHDAVLGTNYFVDVVTQLATGEMMTAYWYIPFIFLVFAASPLFDRFIELSRSRQIVILLGSLAVAFWVHRPYESLDPFHSFLYFVNMYLFGIMVCGERHRLIKLLRKTPVLILLAVMLVGIALAQEFVFHQISNIERIQGEGWMPKGFDAMLVQKYVGVLFFCGLLARWGDHLAAPFHALANASFGMYFVHGIILAAMSHLPAAASPRFAFSPAVFLTYATVTVLLSYATVRTARALLGPRSRYIIGS